MEAMGEMWHTHQDQTNQSENLDTGEPKLEFAEHPNAKKIDKEDWGEYVSCWSETLRRYGAHQRR